VTGSGVTFRVWSPGASRLEVVVEGGGGFELGHAGEGWFEGEVAGLRPGARYRLRRDDGPAMPDPASRWQPEGVHGPSEVIDPHVHQWRHEPLGYRMGTPIYELHLGTFTPQGTCAGAGSRLADLAQLGIRAIELMPIADFPGRWNWGYDGGALFAPARAYGRPEEFKELIDRAHELGLAVLLDVVYNHFGPDGAYAPAFSSAFFTERYQSPWGAGLNFDGPLSRGAREFFIANALYWLDEYRFDGLRLDATHAIEDASAEHFLAELTRRVRGLGGPRRAVIAEDGRNLNRIVWPVKRGGWGLDGVWADDFHHQVRRILAGDSDGYFADFTARTADLAVTIERGWFFTGQPSPRTGAPRGTDPAGIAPEAFVHCIQNHDQVGNRPLGDRLHHQVEPAAWRAASALLLFGAATPLLFMGQEWMAATPFQFFTDHEPGLGSRVSAGRKEEFAGFAGFRGEVADPQAETTRHRSVLEWSERDRDPHAGALRLYRDLLAFRDTVTGLSRATAPVEGGLVVRRGSHALLVALRAGLELPAKGLGERRLVTEDARYCPDPHPPRVDGGVIFFDRPAAVIFESS
jgi:maltooligosyltrehalose trehalohydrolase